MTSVSAYAQTMRILLDLSWIFCLLVMIPHACAQRRPWEKPGCHMLGHSRTVRIEGCIPFEINTNACRGYCLSYAHPSTISTLFINPSHIITSKAECCGIDDTHDVYVEVRCMNHYGGTEFRSLTFKSARSCSCTTCRNL